ncbi:MAG: glycosyltransferase family 2 protein [Bacteroidetes bacterium]|nr:glycosyltransferase family 2 protein [Bacteroidota bacterium]
MASPYLSVIVPSYNGAHRILHTLEALRAQAYADYELIVVVDGSTDGTQELLAARREVQPLQLLTPPNGGRAAARNRGAAVAKGEVLFFLDDDMRPLPDVLERHAAFHHHHPHTCLIGAQLTDPEKYPSDLGRFQQYVEAGYLATVPKTLHCMPATQDYITAAHFSIARRLFEEMGGFDEALTDLEDFDLALRLHDSGHPIWRDESIIAWHDNIHTPAQMVRRQREYFNALDRLHALKPDLLRRRHAYARQLASTRRKWLFFVIATPFWLRRIGRWPLAWLPKKLRYPLYSRIIFGLVNYFPHRKV